MFIVKTNFGHTYKFTPEQVAEDYAATCIQFEDNILTEDQLTAEALSNPKLMEEWFNTYIRDDILLAMNLAELVERDESEEKDFFIWAVANFGAVE